MICVLVSLLVAYYLLVGLLQGLRIVICCLLLGLHNVLRLGLLIGLLVSLLVFFSYWSAYGFAFGLACGCACGFVFFGCFLAACCFASWLTRGFAC